MFVDPKDSITPSLSRISTDHMYSILTSPQPGTLDQLASNPSIPILAISGKVYAEINYITQKFPESEYALFLKLHRLNPSKPHFLAYDLFIPIQTYSTAGVDLNAEDCALYFAELAKAPYFAANGLHRHIAHLHSHASMEVFWSDVDNRQQLTAEDLGFMDDYRFYVVVNTKGQIKCSFVMYSPVLVRVDAAVVLDCSTPDNIQWLTKERKEELDLILEENHIQHQIIFYPDEEEFLSE